LRPQSSFTLVDERLTLGEEIDGTLCQRLQRSAIPPNPPAVVRRVRRRRGPMWTPPGVALIVSLIAS
jgi:hypothetical protein